MQRSYFYGSHDQRAYDNAFLHPEALRSVPLYIGVLSFKGPKSKGLTSSSVKFSGLTSRCLYMLRGFTSSGLDLLLEVLTSKGFTNWSISSRNRMTRGLTFRGLTSSSPTVRDLTSSGLYDQGFFHPGVSRSVLLWIGVFISRCLTSRGHAFRGLSSSCLTYPEVSRSGVLRPVVWRPWALPSGLLYPWVLPPRVLRQGVLHPADLRKSSTVLSAHSVRTQTYFRSTLPPDIRLCSQAAPRALAFSFDVTVIFAKSTW